ncbi:MAG: hypothetical protein IT453_00555 [Planctomycetes bacterium]|jgi:hypothetical protein|nr:hypothetical protein [Planctomycetota bacterium]
MAEIAATRAETSAGDTAFAGATSPLERMLVAFVRALDSERIPHCVLRGHRNFPRLAQGSDVDLLIQPADARRVAAVVERCAREHGVSIWERRRFGRMETFRCYAFAGPGRHEFFGLDVHTAETCFGVPFLAAGDVLARSRRVGELALPDAAQSACIDALGAFLSSGRVPPRHAGALRRAVAERPDEVERELARWFGAAHAHRVVATVRREPDFAPELPLAALRRALLARAFARAPFASLGALARFAWATRVEPWFAPHGRFVAFLGTDGTGKSTVIAGLTDELRRALGPERVASFHLRPGCLPQLNALLHFGRTTYSLADMDRPHRAKPSGRVVSTLRAAYYACDFVVGGWTRVRPWRRHSAVVVFDRYAYDYLVDPLRSRIRLDAPGLRAICGLCPRPQRVLVCTAAAETVRARKRELEEHETVRQLAAYEALARTLPNTTLVRTDGSVQDSVDAAVRAIFEERAP